jgi:hypothetical protein
MENKMEQSAVEWLVDESMKLVAQVMTGTLNEDTIEDDVNRIVTKAKEMEKQQLESLKDFDTWKEWKNKTE